MRLAGVSPASLNPRSILGQVFRRSGVSNSRELERILALPEYRWADDPAIEGLCWQLTRWLRRPGGTMVFRPIQAASLAALHDFGGLLAPIRVGAGKTLISNQAGNVVGAERPLLLIPAKLRDKTQLDFRELSKHFVQHRCLKIMSFELLSRDRGVEELFAYKPDLIIADEAHKLKNMRAACTYRLRQYLEEHPDTLYADMSGTMTKRSIKEYHHRQKWALPKRLWVLPDDPLALKEWSEALDEKVPADKRLAPGALLRLCTDEERASLAADQSQANTLKVVRQGFHRRLTSTPGVVGTEEDYDGSMSISLSSVRYEASDAARESFTHLRNCWETPGGKQIIMATDLWAYARQMALGFCYRWEPEAPAEWLEARRQWSAFARQTLKYNRRKYQTEMQVARACKKGELRDDEYKAWVEIKETFKPNTVPQWIDNQALNAAAKWLEDVQGICWVEYTAWGERLSRMTGLPYYHGGGKDQNGNMIEHATGPIIASIAANKEGRNLQHYNSNLVTSLPPGNDGWEQLIGRTHRDGQEADEVVVDTFVECYEQWGCLMQSILDAQYAQDTLGQYQKLCIADKTIPTSEEVSALAASGDPLWNKDNADFFNA